MNKEVSRLSPGTLSVASDNARKFLIEPLDTDFLQKNKATSYVLSVDWLETAEDTERKIARKEYENGDIQMLLISKKTKDGSRVTEKEEIDEGRYRELLDLSKLHLKKKRYEFEYQQNDALFFMKYDEFSDSNLHILEVDVKDEDSDMELFDVVDFPVELSEVSDDSRYTGYRVVDML